MQLEPRATVQPSAVFDHRLLPLSHRDSAQALDGIQEIQAMLWTPEDFVGYDHVTIRVMDQLYNAMPDVSEGDTPNARRKLEIATSAVDRVAEAVQVWTDGPWQALMEEAQGMDVSLPQLYEAVRGND